MPPYTYNWSNGSTTQDIDRISAGYYFVSVLDENNCTHDRDTLLLQPDTIIILLSTVTDTCNREVGSAEAIISGGNPPYVYLWEPTFSNIS